MDVAPGQAHLRFRDVVAADRDALLALNSLAVPHVNDIPGELLERLCEQAFQCRVALIGARVAGFMIALPPSADYASANFRWFRQRYPEYVYVDRVVVDPGARRAGIARRFYADLESAACRLSPVLAAEVNIEPPNPASMAFHERIGFREVGRQHTEGGSKHVRLMIKRVSHN